MRVTRRRVWRVSGPSPKAHTRSPAHRRRDISQGRQPDRRGRPSGPESVDISDSGTLRTQGRGEAILEKRFQKRETANGTAVVEKEAVAVGVLPRPTANGCGGAVEVEHQRACRAKAYLFGQGQHREQPHGLLRESPFARGPARTKRCPAVTDYYERRPPHEAIDGIEFSECQAASRRIGVLPLAEDIEQDLGVEQYAQRILALKARLAVMGD